ncbi:hypothetical protein MTR67_000902, partial [Solanum verrucosum]
NENIDRLIFVLIVLTRLGCDSKNGIKVSPLTIFYDGKIAIFAENILKFVERDTISSKKQFSVETISGG